MKRKTDMAHKYNLHLIKGRRSYSADDLRRLYGIVPKTFSRWIESGLKVVEEGVRPLLVMGGDLRQFLKKIRTDRKVKLNENEFFCYKCHKKIRARIGTEEIIKTGKKIGKDNADQTKKIGLCEVCGTKVSKFLKVCPRY